MYKVLVVNVIFGIFCIGIFTGCSVKTNKPSNVNKEMTKTKEAVSLDTTISAGKNLIDEIFILAEKLEDVFFDFDRQKIDKYAKEILSSSIFNQV